MPKSHRGHKIILCVIDGMTNYLVMMSIHQARSEEIGDALIDNIISIYGIPEYIIMDRDSTYMSTIMSYLFKRVNIKIKMVAPFNHQSLQAVHGIKSLSSILTKHLSEQGQMWPKFVLLATLAYNTFNSPNLANHSPYELVLGRKPKILLIFETDPDIKITGTFTDYYQLLEKRLKYLQDLLQQYKFRCLAMINKNCNDFQYNSGDLVYIISPLLSESVENKFKKGNHKVCRTLSYL